MCIISTAADLHPVLCILIVHTLHAYAATDAIEVYHLDT